MTLKELEQIRRKWLDTHLPYSMTYWKDFNYKILDNILYRAKAGRGDNSTYNDVIIMADTETSKAKENAIEYYIKGGKQLHKYISVENYVVAFTISLRAFGRNIVTLWGDNPVDFVKCVVKIIDNMNGFYTYMYFHNLSWDWVYLRKFLIEEFGKPIKQLNTKSHYPINIEFANGLILKDSLILAQRGLEKWAKDLDVEHKKACGKWDYNKIRHQNEGATYTVDELEYIEHDTLAGVECIDKLRLILQKSLYSMPYTATGIPREEIRKRGAENHARDKFKKHCLSFKQYLIAEQVYHGGYTHANRHLIDVLIDWFEVQCFDFASSYPFCMCAKLFPCEKFTPLENKDYQYILRNSEKYAFMFKLTLFNVRLKDDFIEMPVLQFSKCVQTINAINDNGRILKCDYLEIYLNEIDLQLIIEQYQFEKHICTEVMVAKKDYLPRWLTDYVYQLFVDKTMLKGGDEVAYVIAKAKLNSIYGCTVQKYIKDIINENYDTGDYIEEVGNPEEIFNKYIGKRTTILQYYIGIWVTSWAMWNLFQLAKCIDYEGGGQWVYTDTDSIYATKWDYEKIEAYNQSCKDEIIKNGYGAVNFNNREYWLGIAESDRLKDVYTQFKTLGAKRYCGRCKADGEIHITVAGVPKKTGAKCLHDDINNFTKGLVFDGITTGKLTHTYNYVDKIYKNEHGDLIGDYIDLTPCDYLLDSVNAVDWEEIETEEIQIQVYEE